MYGIDFEHNTQYPYCKTKYKPTFTAGDVYIDLVDVNKNGSSTRGREYLRDVRWRRNIHEKNKTKYIELQSWYWNENVMYFELYKQLGNNGISVQRRAEEEIYKIINKDSKYKEEFEALLRNFQTFLMLHKNGQYSNKEIKARILTANDEYSNARSEIYLRMYFKIYKRYEKYLESERKYDFADMINLAERLVAEEDGIGVGYRYILLDEVQDLSKNRFLLIRALLKKNPGCKLFAVGDDWQAIYRFAGSDLTLIKNFKDIFELETKYSLIETTHRFGNPTIKISGNFVQKNPLQFRKNIRNIKEKPTPIKVTFNRTGNNNDTDSLNHILNTLIDECGYEKIKQKELQIIGRYNHDIKRITESENIRISTGAENTVVTWRSEKNPEHELRLEFCSMHKSKGITRDIVIVLNINSDLMGMPAMRESDPILDNLLTKPEKYPFAEERRLFYVAITRAREETYLIANQKNPSPFIFEISENIRSMYGKMCPKCESGEIKRKHGKLGDFEYCSNYRYGCNYMKKGL